MSNLQIAKNLFTKGKYSCVLVKGESVICSFDKGVAPLIDIIQKSGNLSGYSAADKIVGKAAALLYVYMGVREVYADVMSHPAVEIFRKNNILIEYDTLTENIQNRVRDGICPIEFCVSAINSPIAAYETLREKLQKA
jgi:hypothetical protein